MGTEKVFNSLIFAEIFGNKERNMYLCRAKLYSQYLKHKFVVLERCTTGSGTIVYIKGKE